MSYGKPWIGSCLSFVSRVWWLGKLLHKSCSNWNGYVFERVRPSPGGIGYSPETVRPIPCVSVVLSFGRATRRAGRNPKRLG